MNRHDRHERWKSIPSRFLYAAMIIGMTAMFAYLWYTVYIEEIIFPFFRRGNWVVIGVYGILLAVGMKINDGNRIGYFSFGQTLLSQWMGTVMVNIMMYLIVSLIGRHFVTVGPIALLSLTQIGFILVWTFISDYTYHKINPPLQMIMIAGTGRHIEAMVNKVASRKDKYIIAKRVNEAVGIDKILPELSKYDAVIICDLEIVTRNIITKYCFENNIRIYVAPRISDVIIRGASEINLFDSPLLLCRNYGLSTGEQIMKRVFDILIALIMLLLLSPLLILIALAIKIEDGGPVFYRQIRLTKDKKEFKILKFRSMIVGAEKNGIQMMDKVDPRITKVGAFIRRFRLDELPQLFNILKGDMSIVGPRPERPELAEKILETIPEFDYRLKVKAGLTGYAQVIGKYNTSPYDKLEMDLMYISQYSLLLDIRIILMTPKMLFIKERTEGVDEQL